MQSFGFGATPTVATEAERQAVITANTRQAEAHRVALARWEVLRRAYEAAVGTYHAKVAEQTASYAAAMRAYESALAAARARAAGEASAYAAAAAGYGAAKRSRDNLIAQNQTNAQRVLGTNVMPPGFAAAGYCATADQVASWRNYCAPVRGLGANEPYCVWQNLAVCSVPAIGLPPYPPPPVVLPTPPARPTPPKAPSDPGPPPKAPLPAIVPTVAAPPPTKRPIAPPPPMTKVTPEPPPKPSVLVPRPPPELPPPPDFAEPKSQNLAVWGILAAVVVVGAGGAYWYLKKRKAAA